MNKTKPEIETFYTGAFFIKGALIKTTIKQHWSHNDWSYHRTYGGRWSIRYLFCLRWSQIICTRSWMFLLQWSIFLFQIQMCHIMYEKYSGSLKGYFFCLRWSRIICTRCWMVLSQFPVTTIGTDGRTRANPATNKTWLFTFGRKWDFSPPSIVFKSSFLETARWVEWSRCSCFFLFYSFLFFHSEKSVYILNDFWE